MRNAALLLTAAICAASPALAGRNHGDDDDRYWQGRYYDRHDRGWHRGHYRPHGYYREEVTVYAPPPPVYTATTIGCTRSYNPLPALLGAGAGAAVGTQIGKGSGRTAAIVGGALIGGMLGGQYGAQVQDCAQEVFATAAPGTRAVWRGQRNEYYAVTPTRDFRQEGRYCREYQNVSSIGGSRKETYGTACMQPDGSWEIVK